MTHPASIAQLTDNPSPSPFPSPHFLNLFNILSFLFLLGCIILALRITQKPQPARKPAAAPASASKPAQQLRQDTSESDSAYPPGMHIDVVQKEWEEVKGERRGGGKGTTEARRGVRCVIKIEACD